MSLLKRKQEKDRKAAEEAARVAEEKKLQDLAIHPLVKDGCGRDARDAYFQGLVFAAIADDDKIDENERLLLGEIGTSLGMSSEEIEETIKSVLSLDDDAKVALVEECVTALKGNEVGVKLFYAQFIKIWVSHEHDEDELSAYLQQFPKWMGVELPEAKRSELLKLCVSDDVADASLATVADWMGDESLRYFMIKQYGDISEHLAEFRNRKEAEETAAAKERDKQAQIMQRTTAFCEDMREFVATHVDRKRVSRNLLLEISDKLPSQKYDGVNIQTVFKNIGKQFLKRVEDLELRELTPNQSFHSNLLWMMGDAVKNSVRFEQVQLIAKETLWFVICLGLLKLDAEDVSIEKWPVGKINKLIDGIEFFKFLYTEQMGCDFWRGHCAFDDGICAFDDGIEDVFGELLGVQSVWSSLFSLTDTQREQLSSWLKKRTSFAPESFEKYAHSIGVSRYCDAKTLRMLLAEANEPGTRQC